MRSSYRNNGTIVFTLPSGFGPTYSMRVTHAADDAHTSFIHISSNREVSVWDLPNNNWCSFDGITFYND